MDYLSDAEMNTAMDDFEEDTAMIALGALYDPLEEQQDAMVVDEPSAVSSVQLV